MGTNFRSINFDFHVSTSSVSTGRELKVGQNIVTANIEISGTGTGTLIFEGCPNDDGVYYPIVGINLSDYSMANTTSLIGSLWQVNLEGLVKFRVNVTEITGVVTVKGTVTD